MISAIVLRTAPASTGLIIGRRCREVLRDRGVHRLRANPPPVFQRHGFQLVPAPLMPGLSHYCGRGSAPSSGIPSLALVIRADHHQATRGSPCAPSFRAATSAGKPGSHATPLQPMHRLLARPAASRSAAPDGARKGQHARSAFVSPSGLYFIDVARPQRVRTAGVDGVVPARQPREVPLTSTSETSGRPGA